MDTFSQTRESIDLFSDDLELQSDSELLASLSLDDKKDVMCCSRINKDVYDGVVDVGREYFKNEDVSKTNFSQRHQKVDIHSPSLTPGSTTRSIPPRTVTSPKRTSAVRGDRSHTGGFPKKILTENELGSIFEKMTGINARKLEVHRRQEADLATFQARVEEETREYFVKAKKEREQQLKMEEERLKNREHKIKSSGRREWDMRRVAGEQEQMRNSRERDSKAFTAREQPARKTGRGGKRANDRKKRFISPSPKPTSQKEYQDWAEEMFVPVEKNKEKSN
ncbi:hypothetical protein HI914_01285 [Erysiphe necator]|uniref:Uncharacterized protein n=1 Tax=Uncinula necator TaxID=52586 RepID=A0A0B1P9P0_UNCNE|nr:hypothetical protein HI914_01285 [Erysiphe necator]KHJ33354.1 hypothetical protein EV44_g2195 [Erysiphe necator]